MIDEGGKMEEKGWEGKNEKNAKKRKMIWGETYL
jgi:hypothetical protein